MKYVLCALLLLACDPDPAVSDAGGDRDSGEPSTDAGRTDAGSVDDGGAADDAGPVDGGAAPDAGVDAGATGDCNDGSQNGDESDVDCGGSCEACGNTLACRAGSDCLSANCAAEGCASPPGTHPDIIRVDTVAGRDPGSGWFDSYSVGNECFCDSTFDHDIGVIEVETPFGSRTVRQVCDALGAGPGRSGRPVYNDIQCGNGPANDAGDEDDCPGRVDIGRDGCGHIGPRWHLHTLTSI